MRREELYLADIVDAADAIERFVEGVDYDDFVGDELRQSAVLQYVQTHGRITRREAAELCQISGPQATRLLGRLARTGPLVRRGQRRGTYYEAVE
jgi:predicted HTH transcriptional regulator